MKYPQEKVMNQPFALRILVLTVLIGLLAIGAAAQTPESNPDIDQCANGGRPAPREDCTGNNWANGNLNDQQSQWVESESVPFRVKYSGTVGDSVSITIEWDTTKGGKHAYDYLTTYDRSTDDPFLPGDAATINDPCSGVTGCDLTVFDTFPIPLDPDVAAGQDGLPGTADDITQIPGVFTCFGCDITAVSAYTLSGTYLGDSTRSITVTFTLLAENVVLAWGGHIASRLDWGNDNSAIAISGSPYHMRIEGQDRSLKVAPAAFPGFVTIYKSVFTNFTPPNNVTSSQTFDFTASPSLGGVTAFSLRDNYDQNTNLPADNLRTDRIVIPVTTGFGSPIRVLESVPLTWDLTDIQCSQADGGLNNAVSTFDVGLDNVPSFDGVDITLQEADFVTCTFINNDLDVTAAQASISGRVTTARRSGISGARITITNAATGETRTALTNQFGFYTVSDLDVAEVYFVGVRHRSYTFAESSKTITLNDDFAGMNFVASKYR